MVAENEPSPTRAAVWIVDDLRSEVASLTRLLSADFTLEIFETGPQMLERLKSVPPPDVLVLEQWLRGPTGVELCRTLRASPATVGLPILLLTVPVDDGEILEGLAAGADDYLIKPFSSPLLAARIVSLVRVKRLRERVERAERAARSERDRFEALIEQNGDGIIAADENGALRVCNLEARRQRGIAPEDSLLDDGAPRFELLTMEGHPIPAGDLPLERAGRGERIEQGRWQVRRRDGTIRVLAGSALPLRHADGSPAGAVLTTRDETERLRLEEALHRSQAWLAMTLESVGDALIATDAAGGVVFMNPVAHRLTGWMSDEAQGRPLEEVFDVVNETTRRRVENPVAKALREGKIVGFENHTVLLCKDGSEVAIDDSAAPIRDAQGRLFGAVLAFRDVSEARRKEAELRTFRALVDASPDVIGFSGLDGRHAYVNPAGRRLIGLESAEPPPGMTLGDYLSPATRATSTSAILAASAAGQAFQGIAELRNVASGEDIPISLSTFTVNNADGKPLMIAAIGRDRRDQVRLEAERARLLAEAEAARREADLQRERLTTAFSQAPVAVSIVSGDEHVVTLVNDGMCRIWGFPQATLLGRPIFDLLVDAKKQGFPEMLAQVRQTGEAFVGRELTATLPRLDGGGVEDATLNFVYQPLRAADGSIRDILVVATDVTLEVDARHRAEQLTAELYASESKLHDLFRQAPVAVAILEGPQHLFALANPAYRALVGGRHLVGKTLFEALPDLEGQGFDVLLDRVMATGETFFGNEMEVRLAHHGEGESLVANFVYTPKRDAEGRVDGVLVSASDVTELVRARRAAEASSAELEAVFNSIPDAAFLSDAQGIRRANPSGLKLLGASSVEELRIPLDELARRAQYRRGTTGEPLKPGKTTTARALAGETVREESFLRNPAGSGDIRVRSVASPIRVGGVITGAVVIHADITERYLIVEALQRSEASFRTLAEAIPQQVWTARPDGILDFVNERVLAYFGVTREQLFGAGRQAAVHPADVAVYVERWTSSLSTGGEYEVEVRLKRADGTYRWHLARAIAVRDAQGEIVKWFGTNTDIHEAKQIREELEGRNRFEQHLLGIVSHDLRNPLGAILLGANGLLEMGESVWVTEIAERIRSSAERSTRMISDLLDFTQARLGGGIQLNRRSVDLHALTTATLREVESLYPDRIVELTHISDTQGMWDADRLAQVVANLATNALKYSLAGTPIHVSLMAQGNRVELSFHNVGTPIPAERLGSIFEPLQRATDAIDMKTRSVGLGLYIVDAIVKAHGGTIGVVSTAEAGTTFRVRLPREPSAKDIEGSF